MTFEYRDRWISYSELYHKTGFMVKTLKKYIPYLTDFPKPVKIGNRATYFDRAEVEAFDAAHGIVKSITPLLWSTRDKSGKLVPFINIKPKETNVKPSIAIEFLAGVYDNQEFRQQHSQRLAAARLNNPATKTVRVIGDFL